jgi:hypothetical protein
MKKRVAILQSNYLPWRGYFDIIGSVDLFIFHDDLQYTKGDWRNRNKIRSSRGTEWLTIPCGTSEKRLICEVELADHSWQRKHWDLIRASYAHAPKFGDYAEFFEDVYLAREWTRLSELNQYLITEISTRFLGMTTVFEDSRKYGLTEAKAARVHELLAKAGAGVYLSGPAAKAYLDEDSFAREGTELEWMDYSNYPEYPQLFAPFEPAVSIIDLLFNVGDEAPRYMKFGQRVAASR